MKILNIDILGKNGTFRLHRMNDRAVQVTNLGTKRSEVTSNSEDLALIIDGNDNTDVDVSNLWEAVKILGVVEFS